MLFFRLKGAGPDSVDVVDKAALVSMLPYPPLDVANKLVPFFGNITVNGDGVTTSLKVDGSTDSIDAFIGAPTTGDLYITTANILIAQGGGAVSLNRFGGISGGLVNGIDLFIETENERIITAKGLKTNFDFIRVATATQGTGGKNDAYLLSNTNAANEDGYNPIIDLKDYSPQGIGLRLRKGSADKLGLTINDSLLALGTFDIVITGGIRI